jgi:N-acetylglucosamine kinase-like BadF-type ATPase
MNDSFAALRAGTDDRFGVVIVAGNGSVVAGRNAEGVEYRSLGLGRLYGDFGSETDISESAITAVAEAFTGLGPPTSLTTMLAPSDAKRRACERPMPLPAPVMIATLFDSFPMDFSGW